jgi:PGAP1-like protein.
MSLRLAVSVLAIFATLVTSGCVFREVSRQQTRLDALCVISGTVEVPDRDDPPVVVLLVRMPDTGPLSPDNVALVDHYVRQGDGRWQFLTGPGTYGLAAFEDRSRTLIYQPGEPFLRIDQDAPVDCAAEGRVENIALVIPEGGRPRVDGEIDVHAIQVRTPDEQLQLSLGMLTATGEVTSLDDPRFAEQIGRDGLWRPFDFLVEARAGVYLLEDYTPDKTPVLYVHGASGTPRNFASMIEKLDRRAFQPWVYYYPSGVRLDSVAQHLDQTMKKLHHRFGFDRVIVIAHSMGGLVARGFVFHHAESRGAEIPLFVTLATPWNGHAAAQIGVDRAPAVVRSWLDMAPGSPFLTDLFQVERDGGAERRSLPDGVDYRLIFAFRRNSASFGVSSDQVVSVASQMRWEAQEDARRVYGFDETHAGILVSEPVAALVNDLLADSVH